MSELGGFLSSLEEKSLPEVMDIIQQLKSADRPDLYLISEATAVLWRKTEVVAVKGHSCAGFIAF